MILANAFSVNLKTGVTLLSILIATAGRVHLVAQPDMAQGGESVPGLSPPTKTIIYSDVKPKGTSLPLFNHGYLIEFVHKTTSPGQPNIYLWNASGNLEHQLAVQPEHSAELYLNSVDVGSKAQLALAGMEETTDGSMAGLIAVSDFDANIRNVIHTGNYVPTHIAIADDRTLWTICAERTETPDGDGGGKGTL